MPNVHRWRPLFSAALATIVAVPLVAQAPSPFSLDVSAGAGIGRGGEPTGWHGGLAPAALIAWHLRSGGRPPLVALGADAQAALGGEDICRPAPGGGCAQDFPRLYAIGLLGGVEVPNGDGSLRILGGPAFYWIEERGRTLGVQARVDFGSTEWRHLAFVMSVRGAVIPRFQGDFYTLGAFGFGLRLR